MQLTMVMTKIKPFRAVIYNQEKIKDISDVVCPPYDVISPFAQERYHELNPYNFIHILLGRDSFKEDKYDRAGKCFSDWQQNQILIQDKTPALYYYSQQYNLKGEKKMRFGFMALLQLGDKNSGVFGHECTRLPAKEDRLKLLKQVKANLSPIFVIFQDQKRIISRLKDKYLQNESPFIDMVDEEKTNHKVWRIDSQEIISNVLSAMMDENIFIADGHHRYEVACAYRDEMQQKFGAVTGQEGFNYILAYFTNAVSNGLTILPIHRLVKLDAKLDIENFQSGIKDYFVFEEVKDKSQFFFLMNKAGEREHIIGMFNEKKYWFLRLKNVKILDKIIIDKPRECRLLDVSILNYIVLQKVLKLNMEDKETITFSPYADELIEKAGYSSSYVAFFLNPVKMQQIMSIALKGEKMPPKSTYFYPKVLSGLVINKLDNADNR